VSRTVILLTVGNFSVANDGRVFFPWNTMFVTCQSRTFLSMLIVLFISYSYYYIILLIVFNLLTKVAFCEVGIRALLWL